MKNFSLFAAGSFMLLHIGTTFTLFHPNAELKKWIYAEDILLEHPRKSVTPLTKCLLGTTGVILGYVAFEGSNYLVGNTHGLIDALCCISGVAIGLKTYSSLKEYILHKKELQQIDILMKEWPEADEVRNNMPREIRYPLDTLHDTYCKNHSQYKRQAELTLKEIKITIARHNNPVRSFLWRLLLQAFGR